MNITAAFIRKIICDKGLKHKAVAGKAGYSEQQFSDMLHGRKNIQDIDVLRIANALNVTPNELFGITSADEKKGD